MLFTDQMGHNVDISNPQRIVSLVPSITELLYDLGAKDRLIGRTKFCIHPSGEVEHLTVIGGTKNVNIQKVLSLNPDLVIANKEENVKQQIELLKAELPVWVSKVAHFSDSMEMIKQLGSILELKDIAESLITQSLKIIKGLQYRKKHRAVYLIWKDPYMTIGGDTYIHDMMQHLGYQNVFENQTRYPIVTIEMIRKINPDLVLLSSEPFPFKEKHIQEFEKELPESRVKLVDGALFSWYGSRILHKNIFDGVF